MTTKTFIPVNRHLLVDLQDSQQENETEHGILLPSDYAPQKSEYAMVKLLDWAEDVKIKPLEEGLDLVVERSMIKEIDCKGQKAHIILENYVLCLAAED